MNCIEYWESQGVDPLDGMFSAGCGQAAAGGPDVLGGFLFLALIVAACLIAKGTGQL